MGGVSGDGTKTETGPLPRIAEAALGALTARL